jgi:ABC-type nitrate/sulfonate/bicarbonate transport system permease component
MNRGTAALRWLTRRLRPALAPLLIVAVLLVLWEILAQTEVLADRGRDDRPLFIPAPSDIGASLVDDRTLLAEDAFVTLQEVLAGFALAVLIAAAFASLLHLFEPLRRSVYPLLVASQTIPIIAIAPVLILWLGYGIGPKLAVIALICFFPITVNTLDGLRSVDPDAVRMMRTLDAGRWRIFRAVEAPTALPFFFSGAKIAVAIAAIGAVFGEWVGSDQGLGHLMRVAQSQLLTDRVFAAVVVLSLIAIGLFALLALLERRLAWWGGQRTR